MSPGPDVAGRSARILIVDDLDDNREVMTIVLVHEGFVILTAASGAEALAVMAHEPPDLVLLDIMMPDMNGYQVVAKIKGNVATKNIPVMMVSAVHDRDAKALALSAGADDFLAKPFDRAELCLRIRKLLAAESTGPPTGAPPAKPAG
jgi:DNA-binding response OmpR family regulator